MCHDNQAMALDIHLTALDSAPLPSATVMLLRDAPAGLEVLMMRRHGNSGVLGGAYVFPGGKVDAADTAPDMLARLDRSPGELHARLGEPDLTPEQAAAFFVAAAREAAEESGLLLLQRGDTEIALHSADACTRLRAGESLAALLAAHGARLDTDALAPWSRWITPRRPPSKRRSTTTKSPKRAG